MLYSFSFFRPPDDRREVLYFTTVLFEGLPTANNRYGVKLLQLFVGFQQSMTYGDIRSDYREQVH